MPEEHNLPLIPTGSKITLVRPGAVELINYTMPKIDDKAEWSFAALEADAMCLGHIQIMNFRSDKSFADFSTNCISIEQARLEVDVQELAREFRAFQEQLAKDAKPPGSNVQRNAN